MRWFGIIFAIVVMSAGLVGSQTPTPVKVTCQLGWDMPATPDLAAFRTYRAQTSKGYVKGTFVKALPQTPPTASTTYTALCQDFGITTEGTYYLAVTAADALGNESEFSTELYLKVDITPPPIPGNLRTYTVTVSTPTTPASSGPQP